MIVLGNRRRRPARLAVTVLGTPLLAAGLSACGGGTGQVNIAAVDVTPDKVDTVTFTAAGKSAAIRFSDGLWTPAAGATVQAATMLTTLADRLFPLNSYRIINGLDQADPAYGLNAPSSSIPECGPACGIRVVTTKGQTWNLTVGRPTFGKAGFYAKVDGDPRTFLITQQAVSDIISEATGTDFLFPESEKYKKVDIALNDVNTAGKSDVPDYDPYLLQVLAAQQADESEKAGHGRGNFVLNAASSTKGLPGAHESKTVTAGTGPTPQAGAGK